MAEIALGMWPVYGEVFIGNDIFCFWFSFRGLTLKMGIKADIFRQSLLEDS